MSWTPAQRRPRRHSTMTLELRAQTPTDEDPPTQQPPVAQTAHQITPEPAPSRPPTRSTTQLPGESIPKNQKPKKKTKQKRPTNPEPQTFDIEIPPICPPPPVDSRIPSRPQSPAHTSASNRPPSPDPRFKFTIKEIPLNIATQKAFYTLLVSTLGLKSIVELRVNHNRTALLITDEPLAPNFSKYLQISTNNSSITITPIKQRNPAEKAAPKKPIFSVVIRNVPQDISPEEIATLCPSLSVTKAWRIISRKTNQPTSFIRVLTNDKGTVDTMLIDGVELYGRFFTCETSHVGHDEEELRSKHLSTLEKTIVVEKLKSGVPVDRILEDARKWNTPKIERYNLLKLR
jgi:hypothetical protein